MVRPFGLGSRSYSELKRVEILQKKTYLNTPFRHIVAVRYCAQSVSLRNTI
jgi:hypothetical protein